MELRGGGDLEHDIRLWESEAMLESGINPEQWYPIEVKGRENLIATMLARRWIENVAIEDATKK